jgi:hypothetical protein
VLTLEQRQTYERNGSVLVQGLFDAVEAELLRTAMETDPQVRSNLYDRLDAAGDQDQGGGRRDPAAVGNPPQRP